MTGGHCKVVEHEVQKFSGSIHLGEQLQHIRSQRVALGWIKSSIGLEEDVLKEHLEPKSGELEEFTQFIGERAKVVVVKHQLP